MAVFGLLLQAPMKLRNLLPDYTGNNQEDKPPSTCGRENLICHKAIKGYCEVTIVAISENENK